MKINSRQIAIMLFANSIIFFSGFILDANAAPGESTTICHVTGNNFNTLNVKGNNLQSHLDHGDQLGACEDDADIDGYAIMDGDCNDSNAGINPGATDIPGDGIDQDCSGADAFADNDSDGFTSDVDCNDNDPSINPGATDIPGDGIDQDCSGADATFPDNDSDDDELSLPNDPNDGKGGKSSTNTRPTFGYNHENLEDLIVDTGFTFNGNSFTLTDNHHTPFEQQTVEIGAVNSFAATVYAQKDLKVQEFLFGVPKVGMGHLAETRVEVWFDQNGQIKDTFVVQDTEVIDRTSVKITHQKSKCHEQDIEEKCNTTIASAVFLEPLQDNVMAIKAIDFKLRDQTTYFNDGFDISGDSLNPMPTKMMPSPTKGEGLIKVTQNEKYSDYWNSDDGRIFEMNTFGSFTQKNHQFERFKDSGTAYTREHSEFVKVITYEQNKALGVFDSSEFISELPESFAYVFPESGKRISDEMIQEMKIQEHIAQKRLDEIVNQQTRWN